MNRTTEILLGVGLVVLGLAGCSSDALPSDAGAATTTGATTASTATGTATTTTGGGSGGSGGAGGAGGSGEPDCYANPTKHVEIINACTDAEAVSKTPVLPLLGADGSLPPLP